MRVPSWLDRVLVVLLVLAAPVGVYLLPEEGPSHPKHWDARVLDLVHYVEQERGLRFKHPVGVEFLDDKDFKAKVSRSEELTDKDKKELSDSMAELRALGLVKGHPDPLKALDQISAQLVGVYVPDDQALYVRGTSLTPYVRTTLVHELTHAVQDQWFDITKLIDSAEDDSIVRVLIEGDATRIQEAYQRGLSQADQQAYADAEAAFADDATDDEDDLPAALQDAFSYPYVFGPAMLDVIVADGGNASVDKAFRHPPVTDAQVVDLRAYPLSFTPKKLPSPTLPEGAKTTDDAEVFGQVWLLEVLGSVLGYDETWAAVQGWAGDTVRSYTQNGTSCVALDVAMKDEAAARRLAVAVDTWAATPSRSSSRAGAVVSLRGCDPGDAEPPSEPQPRAFDVLATRAQIVHEFVRSAHVGFSTGRCMADEVLAELGPAQVVGLNDDASITPQQQLRIQQVVEQAYEDC
jgi:hypothetical protein